MFECKLPSTRFRNLIIEALEVKKYLVIVLLCLPILLSGCFKFEDIRLIAVKDVTYREFRDNVLQLDIMVTVDNPNRYKVKIKDGKMELKFKDKTIGNLAQTDRIELEANAKKDYKIRATVEMKDLTAGLLAAYRIFMNESDRLSLSGSVHVKSFMYSKTLQVENLSFQ